MRALPIPSNRSVRLGPSEGYLRIHEGRVNWRSCRKMASAFRAAALAAKEVRHRREGGSEETQPGCHLGIPPTVLTFIRQERYLPAERDAPGKQPGRHAGFVARARRIFAALLGSARFETHPACPACGGQARRDLALGPRPVVEDFRDRAGLPTGPALTGEAASSVDER